YSSMCVFFFFFSSRRRHTRSKRDWSSDVCSSDLADAGSLRVRLLGSFPDDERHVRRHGPLALPYLDWQEPTVRVVARAEKGERRSEERRVGKEWRAGWAA